MKNWNKYVFPFGDTLPSAPAVYVIYINDELVYVGQTTNLRNRLSNYCIRYGYSKTIITPWGDFDSEIPLIVKAGGSRKYGDWAMRELRLIKRLRPRFNIIGLGRKKRAA